MLLLIPDEVLNGADDSLALQALDRLGAAHAAEVGISTEAFPPATGGRGSHEVDHREEGDVDSLASELGAESGTALFDEVAVCGEKKSVSCCCLTTYLRRYDSPQVAAALMLWT